MSGSTRQNAQPRVDVSPAALERASRRLGLAPPALQANARVRLLQGALTYRDRRLAGFDAAAVVEVVEHIDPERLPAFEEAVFRTARPGTVVLTTPNRDYNGRFATLAAGTMRHSDHRFEWSRAEFRAWADGGVQPLRLHRPHRAGRRGRSGARRADPDGGLHPMRLSIPDFSLVVLIGPSGSGKSTFARRCFRPTEVVSSDACRALVADDETDQAATPAAFEVLRLIVAKRLGGAPPDRDRRHQCPRRGPAGLVELARAHYALAVAIVFDVGEEVCQARNRGRPDRQFGPHVVRNQAAALRRSLKGLGREGFRFVHRLSLPGGGGRGRDRAPAAVDRPALRDRALRHHRRRPRLP